MFDSLLVNASELIVSFAPIVKITSAVLNSVLSSLYRKI